MNCCMCQFSNDSDYVFSISITDITEYHFVEKFICCLQFLT